MNTEQLQALAQPFAADLIEWKPGATSKDKTSALALAYVDLRRYFDRLDAVAPGEWADDYDVLGEGTIVKCRLTITGVTRCDVGQKDEADQNTTTGAAAQAFKRTCAKFGLGRHLYDMPQVWADYDAFSKRFTNDGLAKLRNTAQQTAGRPAPKATTKTAGATNGEKPTVKPPPPAQKAPESAYKPNGNGHKDPEPAGRPQWAGIDEAKRWAMKQGDAAGQLVYDHSKHVDASYDKLRRTALAGPNPPKSAADFFDLWYVHVLAKIAEANIKLSAELDAAAAGDDNPLF